MYAMRLWSVRRARAMEAAYAAIERALLALDPLFRRVGYAPSLPPACPAQ